VTPFIIINGIFRVVKEALFRNTLISYMGYQALLVTGVIILRFLSMVVSDIALSMGAPPKPPKDLEKNAK
jgi:hypothetical protein